MKPNLFLNTLVFALLPTCFLFSTACSALKNTKSQSEADGIGGPGMIKPKIEKAAGVFVVFHDPVKLGTIMSLKGEIAALIAKSMDKAAITPENPNLASKKFSEVTQQDVKAAIGKNISCFFMPVQEGDKLKVDAATGLLAYNVRCDIQVFAPNPKSGGPKVNPAEGKAIGVLMEDVAFGFKSFVLNLERGSKGNDLLALSLLDGQVRPSAPDLLTRDYKDINRGDYESRSNHIMGCSNIPEFDATTQKILMNGAKMLSKWDCTKFVDEISTGSL
jgi:hypothetical protein